MKKHHHHQRAYFESTLLFRHFPLTAGLDARKKKSATPLFANYVPGSSYENNKMLVMAPN
jgi:hypothetical protein